MRSIIFPLAVLLFLFSSSSAWAEEKKADRNAEFWNEWSELKETDEWKSLEETTTIIRRNTDGKSSSSGRSPNKPIVDASINDVSDAAQFLADVSVNRVEGAESAISTVVNMRTRPDIRAKSQELVPPEQEQEVREFVERIPPGRYFTDFWSTQHSTSAFLPNPTSPVGAGSSSPPVSGGGNWTPSPSGGDSGSVVTPRSSAPPGYTPPSSSGAGCPSR